MVDYVRLERCTVSVKLKRIRNSIPLLLLMFTIDPFHIFG